MASKKTTFHGHKNTLRDPATNAPLEKGDTFDAPELWLRQHQPYLNCGALTFEDKPAPKKRGRPKKTKADE